MPQQEAEASSSSDFYTQASDTKAVHRFLHKTLKIHFYTASESEKANILTNLTSVWQYEGIAYSVAATNQPNTIPVHRFLHKTLKIHFYTASESEKTYVINNLSDNWIYEGVAFRAFTSNASGAGPVYRMLNKDLKVHFYTASQNEKDSVVINLGSDWEYEGIGYYAKGTPRPQQVAENCPISTKECVPCTSSDPLCRIQSGKSTGYQGWSCQNNNLGNIRYSSARNVIIEAEGGEAACGERGGFMVFRDYTIGRNSTKAYLRGIRNNRHSSYLPACQDGDCTLKEFFAIYAPAGDQNDPESYANHVAEWTGTNADSTTLAWMIDNKFDEFLDAIKRQEGWFEL